jgi:hypothetical protein
MVPDQEDRDPAQARAKSRAAEVGAGAVMERARAAPVFVRAAEKKRRIN